MKSSLEQKSEETQALNNLLPVPFHVRSVEIYTPDGNRTLQLLSIFTPGEVESINFRGLYTHQREVLSRFFETEYFKQAKHVELSGYFREEDLLRFEHLKSFKCEFDHDEQVNFQNIREIILTFEQFEFCELKRNNPDFYFLGPDIPDESVTIITHRYRIPESIEYLEFQIEDLGPFSYIRIVKTIRLATVPYTHEFENFSFPSISRTSLVLLIKQSQQVVMSDNRQQRVRKPVKKFEFDQKDAAEKSPLQSVTNLPTSSSSIPSASRRTASTNQSSLQSVTNLPTSSSTIPSSSRRTAPTNPPATKKPKKEENENSRADIITLSDDESEKKPTIDASVTSKRKTPSSATRIPRTSTPGFRNASGSCSTSSTSSVQNGSRKSSSMAPVAPPSSSASLQNLMAHRPKIIKKEFIAGPIVKPGESSSSSGGLGEIRVQPERLVFNAPYIFDQRNRIMITNKTNRYLAFKMTLSNSHRHFLEHKFGVISPLENFYTSVKCASFEFKPEVIEKHRIIIQWTNVPGGVTELSRDWFEGDGIVGTKTIHVRYSH
ncbi:hypothetical protein B9Z55_023193 [Caenorhabditis nigoni]|nr:hypothetical protein B9Z55_023193 [Caenorhabditis nigoni]